MICKFVINLTFSGGTQGSKGMQWSNLKDEKNGMSDVMVILFVEWIVFLVLTLYLDQVVSSASGINKHPLFFLNFKRKDKASTGANISSGRSSSRKLSGSSKSLSHMIAEDNKIASVRPDVAREVSHAILHVCFLTTFGSSVWIVIKVERVLKPSF